VKKESPESNKWAFEKRELALKLINNASMLTNASSVFRKILEKNPDPDLRQAVKQVDEVVEELKTNFNKNYFI